MQARTGEKDEVLELGCGWRALATEVVKLTGCNYTGIITLSMEQLKYAGLKVKEAGLQVTIFLQWHHIPFTCQKCVKSNRLLPGQYNINSP